MPSTSTRSGCLTSSGLPGPTGCYAIGDYAWCVSPIVLVARHRRLRRPRWGTAGHGAEPGRSCSALRRSAPLAADPAGAAGRGPRATAEAARHNVTKLHRPRTYRDAGRERALGAASRSTRQARASTSRCHWSRIQKELRASREPEEQAVIQVIAMCGHFANYSRKGGEPL